jgi:LPXTG-motif cell wall-anchored protein
VSLVVPEGASESQTVALDGIAWKQGQSYTIVELTSPEPYRFHQFNSVASAAYTFTYNPETNQALICSNILSEWEIQVNKVDSVEGDPLSGAVFGLYSLSQSGILSEAEAAAHGAETVITVDGTVWYLKAIGESDADGALNIQHLTEDQYYLLELKAPDGYNLPETGQIVYRVDAIGGIRSLTVKNRPGYEIPETGGAGTTSYTLGGLLLMMAAAILLYIHTLKRRKEDLTSF